MKYALKIHFRRIIIGCLFSVFFLVVIIGSYNLNKRNHRLMEDSLVNNFFAPAQKMQAENIAMTLNNQIRSIADVLKTAAEYRSFQSITNTCSPEQKLSISTIKIALGEVADHIALVDKNGIIICNTNENLEGTNIANYTNTQEALLSQKIAVSRAFINPSGDKVISVTIPIFSQQDGYLGFIGSAINIKYFEEQLSGNYKFTPSSYNVLVDDDGTILYHPDSNLIMENVFGEAVQKITSASSGFNNMIKKMLLGRSGHDFYTFDDTNKVAGYAPVELAGGYRFWSVASTAELREYYYITDPFFIRGQFINLAFIFIAFLLILFVAYFLDKFESGNINNCEKNGKD